MAKHYEEWTPEPFDPGTDALSAQVGERETEGVQRDPEIDAQPVITRVHNGRQASPREAFVDHYAGPPAGTPPVVDRVEIRSHLEPRPESTDRHSDDQLDRQAAEREAER
jgi:hypothetical protein